MAKYIFIEQQDGGCDYTIGCGIRVSDKIEADTPQQAIEIFKTNYLDGEELTDFSANPLSFDDAPNSITVYEVSNKIPFSLDQWREEWDEFYSARAKEEQEKTEKETYERLKRKYNKAKDILG